MSKENTLRITLFADNTVFPNTPVKKWNDSHSTLPPYANNTPEREPDATNVFSKAYSISNSNTFFYKNNEKTPTINNDCRFASEDCIQSLLFLLASYSICMADENQENREEQEKNDTILAGPSDDPLASLIGLFLFFLPASSLKNKEEKKPVLNEDEEDAYKHGQEDENMSFISSPTRLHELFTIPFDMMGYEAPSVNQHHHSMDAFYRRKLAGQTSRRRLFPWLAVFLEQQLLLAENQAHATMPTYPRESQTKYDKENKVPYFKI